MKRLIFVITILFIFSPSALCQWTNLSSSQQINFYSSVYMLDSANGWACCKNSALLKTTDGGETWSFKNLPGYLITVNFLDKSTGFILAIDEAKNAAMVYKTYSGGETWEIDSTLFKVCADSNIFFNKLDVSFQKDSSKIWVYGGTMSLPIMGYIYFSKDKGLTWKQYTKVPSRNLAAKQFI